MPLNLCFHLLELEANSHKVSTVSFSWMYTF
jgi:hypothetical protein